MATATTPKPPEGVAVDPEWGTLTLTTPEGVTVGVYVTQYGDLAVSLTGQPGCDHDPDAEPVQVIATFDEAEHVAFTAAIAHVVEHGHRGHKIGHDPERGTVCHYCRGDADPAPDDADEDEMADYLGPLSIDLGSGRVAHPDCHAERTGRDAA